jgi:hypothetical protein
MKKRFSLEAAYLLGVALVIGTLGCSHGDQNLGRRGGPVDAGHVDTGSALPEAGTTGETQIVVLPDGGTIEVVKQADGGFTLADGGLVIGLEAGVTAGFLSLKCDVGSLSSCPARRKPCSATWKCRTDSARAMWFGSSMIRESAR